MNNKEICTALGCAGVVLWFMPLAYVEFMGLAGYQAGHHIGGIAHLLLLALLAYAALSWTGQRSPQIFSGVVALAVSLLLLASAGESAAWGLYLLTLVCLAGTILAVKGRRAPPPDNRNAG